MRRGNLVWIIDPSGFQGLNAVRAGVSDCRLKERKVGFVLDECFEDAVACRATDIFYVLVRADIPVSAAVLSFEFGARGLM